MARIKVKDLPKDTKISKDEMKRVKGGLLTTSILFGKVESAPDIKFTTSLDSFLK
jgi:hypothetical protein